MFELVGSFLCFFFNLVFYVIIVEDTSLVYRGEY